MFRSIIAFFLALNLLACAPPTPDTPTPDLDATLESKVSERVQAELSTAIAQLPTSTSLPPPIPNNTPKPATVPPTTLRPTYTPRPTNTPIPTPSIADLNNSLRPWVVQITSSHGSGTGSFIRDPPTRRYPRLQSPISTIVSDLGLSKSHHPMAAAPALSSATHQHADTHAFNRRSQQ